MSVNGMRSRGNRGGTCDPYIFTLVRRAPKARVMVTLWYNRGEEIEEQVSHPDLSIRLHPWIDLIQWQL